jgi:tetratricopeptide (TPR) repeat protein
MPSMPRLRRLIAVLVLTALAAPFLRADKTAPREDALKTIVADQNALFTKAEAQGDALDLDNFQSQLQQLCRRYDALIAVHKNYAPAHVAYGMLLTKAGMRKEGVAHMLKANDLDSRIPLVKNQLGNYYAEEGKPVEALVFFTAASDLEPKEPLYHHQIGSLLCEGAEDFLATGDWTRPKLDEAMQDAFEQAMNLAPGDWRHAYRYGLSFYDLATPEWEAALRFWRDFEKKLSPGIERQTCRLHQARVLVELRRLDEARAALAAVTASELVRQRAEIEKKLAAVRARAANPDIVVTGGTVGPPAEENPPAEAAPPAPSGATGTASPPP